jgi:hypothetical protein
MENGLSANQNGPIVQRAGLIFANARLLHPGVRLDIGSKEASIPRNYPIIVVPA